VLADTASQFGGNFRVNQIQFKLEADPEIQSSNESIFLRPVSEI
jgi:hypothetical protein